MTLKIFLQGLKLQLYVVAAFCLIGILFGSLGIFFGASAKSVKEMAQAPKNLSKPFEDDLNAKTSDSKDNTFSWHYYMLNNGFSVSSPLLLFYFNLLFLKAFSQKLEPGNLTSIFHRFIAFYLKLLGLQFDTSPAFLNMAMMLSFVSVIGLGILAFLFGLFIPAAIKLTGPVFFFGAILPHGVFEISAAIASGSIPLAVLAEIVRRKRENPLADSYQIAREIGLSKKIVAYIVCIYTAVLIASVIESHYTGIFVENYLLPKYGMGGELGDLI